MPVKLIRTQQAGKPLNISRFFARLKRIIKIKTKI